MSEKETVEVTVKIPKRLMDVLEAEHYFGWPKEDFFVVSLKRGISCEVNDLGITELDNFHKKYGTDLDGLSFDLLKQLKT